MPNHASRVGIGLKLSRNEIVAAARLRRDGKSWAEIGRTVGVSGTTARKTVDRWGDDEIRQECEWRAREAGGTYVRCGDCHWSDMASASACCPRCGKCLDLIRPTNRKGS